MKVVLTNLSDDLYEFSRIRLNESAKKFGIQEIHSYSFNSIKGTDFYFANKRILDYSKGTGAWLWKPYIILETLRQVDEGDVVVYADSGIEIVDSLDPVISICRDIEDVVVFANGGFINAWWTKRDTFILMDSDDKRFWFSPQCDASFSLFKKTEKSLRFVNDWLRYCTDERILTDQPNTCGKKNIPGFVEHRWDQSVLSLLAVKFDLPLFRVPTQFGNHYKDPAFRLMNEFNCLNQMKQKQLDYYAKNYYSNSPYFQLLNHHRTKSVQFVPDNNKTGFRDMLFRAIKKRWRCLAGELFMWNKK